MVQSGLQLAVTIYIYTHIFDKESSRLASLNNKVADAEAEIRTALRETQKHTQKHTHRKREMIKMMKAMVVVYQERKTEETEGKIYMH